MNILNDEMKTYQTVISVLKRKLVKALDFVLVSTSDQKHSKEPVLEKLMRQNDELQQKIHQISSENENLRALLKLNQTHNSLKAMEAEIAKIEQEATQKKRLSPSREQEEQEKAQIHKIAKESIREKARRIKRKRTESFHENHFSESSPEEKKEPAKDTKSALATLRRRSVRSGPIGFGGGYKMQMAVQEDKPEQKPEEQKEPEPEKSSLSEKKSKLKSKAIGKRRRTQSTDEFANDFQGLSPPNNSKRPLPKKAEEPEEDDDYFGLSLRKGSGYKMSMEKSVENTTEDNKSTTSDDDYFGAFNKKKRSKRIQSMAVKPEENEQARELASSKYKLAPKIKYSIHSIIEEEKSKSSSSTSSVRSSDDLTFYFNK